MGWWELFCLVLPKGTDEHDKVVAGLGSAAAIQKAVEECKEQLGIAFSEGALRQTLLGTLSNAAGQSCSCLLAPRIHLLYAHCLLVARRANFYGTVEKFRIPTLTLLAIVYSYCQATGKDLCSR